MRNPQTSVLIRKRADSKITMPRKLPSELTQDTSTLSAALRAVKINPHYTWIAAHIEVTKMHKSLRPSFSETMLQFQNATGAPVLQEELIAVIEKNHQVLDAAVIHMRDYDHSYGMIEEIQKRFLARSGDAVIERIQHMFMRMAVSIHMDDIPNVLATYELLSSGQVIHDASMASNAGFAGQAISSTYTMAFSDMNMKDMYESVAKCLFAIRNGAKVAVSAQGVPCSGRSGACRHDDNNIGLWPMLKFLDGAISFARRPEDKHDDIMNILIEPWHVDVTGLVEFNEHHRHGLSTQKSLTFSLSVPDIFMSRVENDEDWTLFCPHDVPDLPYLRGTAFDDAYTSYEASNTRKVTIRARDLWDTILRFLIVTGGPSLIYKDTVYEKSNIPEARSVQFDLRSGVIDTFGIPYELSPRNHASIALPLLISSTSTFDFASALNARIAETMYYAALEASCELAEEHGPYEAFSQSPTARGVLQFDMWLTKSSPFLDWITLRNQIRTFGLRNAVMIAIGPGRCTEVYSGFASSVDPSASNVYNQVVSPWLVDELSAIGMWNNGIRQQIIREKGSIQDIDIIPSEVKNIFRTAWEIDPEVSIQMARERAPFVCHTESLSLYMESPTPDALGALLMRTWASELKVGIHKLQTGYADRQSKASSSDDDPTDREMSFEDFVLTNNE
ncbi:hypothetical protein B0H16DRAFT_1460659 [Mycena metata]|uniref:Ribonucleoside-diphosphate reductase n=1 Tax=Mycena metata TaxID=1033252 RepID=A0AAD7IVC9_9AGAR|nr:hypothetical protein B0H16DRAFT_1460659 [Mycena metata]